jgi:hypothetical protein
MVNSRTSLSKPDCGTDGVLKRLAMRFCPSRHGVVSALMLLGAVFFLSWTSLCAQEENPADEDRAMSREERIRQHREDIRRIIQERRELQSKAAESTDAAVVIEGAAPPPSSPSSSSPPSFASAPGTRGAAVPSAVSEPRAAPSRPGEEAVVPSSPSDIMLAAGCILMVTPLDNIVMVNKRFVTRVELSDSTNNTLDALSIRLKYDPRFLSPVRVFDDEIRGYLIPPPSFEQLRPLGVLAYEGRFREPRILPPMTILTVVWEALRPTEYTEISFDFSETGPSTALTFRGQDMLGIPEDPFDGVIGASVLIRRPEDPKRAGLLQGKKEELLDFLVGGLNPPGAIGLAFGVPEKPIRIGEVFDIPIYFRNPDALSVDFVSLYIRFDPRVLEVVDHDKNNWIRREVNLFDGDRHLEYPFDYLVRNYALNARGLIDYRKGLSRARPLPTGRLVTIRLRALAPSPATTLELLRNERGGSPGTAVSLHGRDYLDLSGGGSKPALTFRVLP